MKSLILLLLIQSTAFSMEINSNQLKPEIGEQTILTEVLVIKVINEEEPSKENESIKPVDPKLIKKK